jgi:hypothetical protein
MILILFSTILLIPVLSGLGKDHGKNLWNFISGISGKILSGIMGISLVWHFFLFYSFKYVCRNSNCFTGIILFFKETVSGILSVFKKRFIFNCLRFIIILFTGTYYPYILDHFGYYVPTIKWLTEYGFIKGISNLDLTLGQMSVWHIFQAGFSNFSDPF